MLEPTALSFCPTCQELFAPPLANCPGCGHGTVRTAVELPEVEVKGLADAVDAYGVATVWLREEAAHAALLAELLLRAAQAA